jgi:hypothetical protein
MDNETKQPADDKAKYEDRRAKREEKRKETDELVELGHVVLGGES